MRVLLSILTLLWLVGCNPTDSGNSAYIHVTYTIPAGYEGTCSIYILQEGAYNSLPEDLVGSVEPGETAAFTVADGVVLMAKTRYYLKGYSSRAITDREERTVYKGMQWHIAK